MRPLFYSINLTLDGCCDHRGMAPNPELHRYATQTLRRADALLFGRHIYQMMEEAFRPPAPTHQMPDWMQPFVQTINAAPKFVVSSTLESVDWNARLIRGDLKAAVVDLKNQPGTGIYTGGVTLPLALAELGLIDEYEFIIQPRIAGHGPALFHGLSQAVDLKLVGQHQFECGAVALRYVPQQEGPASPAR